MGRGRTPPEPEPAPATGRPGAMAEDPPELQHPILLRLRTGVPIGAGVRQAAVWAAGARLLSQVLQFLSTIVTARLLVPDDYGKTAIIFPIVAFALILTNLGLSAAVIHASRVTEKLLSGAFWLNAATGVALTLLVSGLSFPLARFYGVPSLVPLLCLASLNFALNLRVVHTALLERTLRFKQIAAIETACTVLNIGSTVAAAVAGAGAYSLVLGPLVYTVSMTVVMWWSVRWVPRARPDRATLAYLWSFSRGITGFYFLNFWARNADNLALGRFVSQADLGLYSRAYNLMKLPVEQMNVMMSRVLFPALTRLRDEPERLGRAWSRALVAAATVTAPLTVGMAVAAPAMIEVLYGDRWLGIVPVLQLLALAALPQILTTTVAGLLRAAGEPDLLFRLGVITSAMSLVAIAVGLPWGTVGVAAALLVKFYLEVLVVLRTCLRLTRLRVGDLARMLRGIVAACLVLAGTGLTLRLLLSDRLAAWQVLLLQLGCCAAAYLLTLLTVDRAPLRLAWSLAGSARGRAGPVVAVIDDAGAAARSRGDGPEPGAPGKPG